MFLGFKRLVQSVGIAAARHVRVGEIRAPVADGNVVIAFAYAVTHVHRACHTACAAKLMQYLFNQ